MADHCTLLSTIPIIPAGGDLTAAIEFYEKLGFGKQWEHGDTASVRRDTVEIMLFRNDDKHLAEWTSLRVQVSDVASLYQEFQDRGGEMLHPNGKLQTKPWGTTEFAIIDLAGVCITFFQAAESG